jgi:transcriptional regulator with XRE-family HTH domain
MIICDRLRELQEERKLSRDDIEKKTGLLRCYVSRVENGHTVPNVDTLEKLARALEVPMYKLLYDGEESPKLPNLLKRKTADDILWGNSGKDAHMHRQRIMTCPESGGRRLAQLCRLFGRIKESNFGLPFYMVQKLARRRPD